MKRFVDLNEERERLKSNIFYVPPEHCRVCGDTKPKHGFYPLYSQGYSLGGEQLHTSPLECNECRLTDKQYEEYFNEPKEKK